MRSAIEMDKYNTMMAACLRDLKPQVSILTGVLPIKSIATVLHLSPNQLVRTNDLYTNP